jgi:hypothetical protein
VTDGPVLTGDLLEVHVAPDRGAEIVRIVHRPTGADVLWRTPWGGRPAGRTLPGLTSQAAWIQQSPGGWQVMLPNGGAECHYHGLRYDYHGEAALSPWTCERDGEALALSLELFGLPLSADRTIRLDADVLTVTTTVRNRGVAPVELVWGEHIGFGGELLTGPATITTGARRVVTQAGDTGGWLESDWPYGQLGNTPADLRDPLEDASALAYLIDFAGAWAAITRSDGTLGAAICWDAEVFGCAWLWQELGGSTGWPWFGRTRVIGIEPCTSWPSAGIAAIAEQTGTQRMVGSGQSLTATVRMHVFTGLTDVAGVADGRAVPPND